jgi:hypothetical protein
MTKPNNVERLFDKNIVMDLMTAGIIHYLMEEHCVRVEEDKIAEHVMANFDEIVELIVNDDSE